jgi:hypothetical protein
VTCQAVRTAAAVGLLALALATSALVPMVPVAATPIDGPAVTGRTAVMAGSGTAPGPTGTSTTARTGPDPTGRSVPPTSQRVLDSVVWFWILAVVLAAATWVWVRRRDTDGQGSDR